MTSILISGKDKKELEVLAFLAEKMGVKVRHITSDETEDILLGGVMEKVRTNKKVTKNSVMKILLPKQ